jgi:hypothetical protein
MMKLVIVMRTRIWSRFGILMGDLELNERESEDQEGLVWLWKSEGKNNRSMLQIVIRTWLPRGLIKRQRSTLTIK